ncbi:MAG: hypothetical protein ACP5E3_18565, partial [Bacteroidales bacterium]
YEENQVPVQKVWHTYTDHLGSLVYCVKLNFRECANRKFIVELIPISPSLSFGGQWRYEIGKHLTEFGLINMNGRVYVRTLILERAQKCWVKEL